MIGVYNHLLRKVFKFHYHTWMVWVWYEYTLEVCLYSMWRKIKSQLQKNHHQKAAPIIGFVWDVDWNPGLAGPIIATSHEFSPQMVVKSKGNSLFEGNLGWWNIMIWPEYRKGCLRHWHGDSHGEKKMASFGQFFNMTSRWYDPKS